MQEFIKVFKAKNKSTPNMFAAIAYDSITIMANIIEKVGTDRKAIRDELAKMQDFVGMTGKFTLHGATGRGQATTASWSSRTAS